MGFGYGTFFHLQSQWFEVSLYTELNIWRCEQKPQKPTKLEPNLDHGTGTSIVKYRDCLFAFGGFVCGGTASVSMFDPQTLTWTRKTRMKYERGHTKAIVCGNFIYVFG